MNDDRAYTYRVYGDSRNKAVAGRVGVTVKLFCWRRLIRAAQSGYEWRLIEGGEQNEN